MHIYYNFRYKESEEKKISDLMSTFIPFKYFDLPHSRLVAGSGAGDGTGATSKFLPVPDAAPQHLFLLSIQFKFF
jgi:hypothetical protein